MNSRIELLDCTLRDGAYINKAQFGEQTIGGIIKRLQDANVDLIECGWLKDDKHVLGTSYYHIPSDLEQYLFFEKDKYAHYVAMVDYNRYDVSKLPDNSGKNIDSIRVVFPRGKQTEALSVVRSIQDKGYGVFMQAANTLSYSDDELRRLVEDVNRVNPIGLSIVDTFGAMYPSNLSHIYTILDKYLEPSIKLGFHSHNNQQLSFALSIQYVSDMMKNSGRNIIIDSSLCGMGRGAGNTNTELIANYLNKEFYTDYDINAIMDVIDVYMAPIQKQFFWGYSIPYYIAGMYETHVNNVAYLTETHAIKNKDLRQVFSSLEPEMRRTYNYDNLEKAYVSYNTNEIDDTQTLDDLRQKLSSQKLVVILPGEKSKRYKNIIDDYITRNKAIVIGINSVQEGFKYDYLYFTSEKKYEYAKESLKGDFNAIKKIITSNIRCNTIDADYILNYNDLQKYGWKYYDNSMLTFLRLLKKIVPASIAIAGFDGYQTGYSDSYVSTAMRGNLSPQETIQLQSDIESMLRDFSNSFNKKFDIQFLTPSPFEEILK